MAESSPNGWKILEKLLVTFSRRVENTVGKGEIALYEQFLLFPQCFQKIFTTGMYKPGLVWERVKDGFR